jgi:hypothetical protein
MLNDNLEGRKVSRKNILQEMQEGADRMTDINARTLASSPQTHTYRLHIREESC